ncbi:hypothetical protein BKD26_08580 [Streptomyces sp. CB03238]|nr:hypothetical protein BKD26_08580 [Streptomyces sp. CB03238]
MAAPVLRRPATGAGPAPVAGADVRVRPSGRRARPGPAVPPSARRRTGTRPGYARSGHRPVKAPPGEGTA